MRELAFVGLSEDGTSLVLSSTDGTRYTVPCDERLEAAVRAEVAEDLLCAQHGAAYRRAAFTLPFDGERFVQQRVGLRDPQAVAASDGEMRPDASS